ncbi:MAG: hypothetical protein HOE14_14280, partial [Gemmatimonadales bacterium]|nr:hypothetical protein [Gemmatimonadales bacterium]
MDPNRDEVVQRLSRLRDQGLLSEEEFDEQVRSHMADDETSSAGIDESVETVKPKVDGRRAEPVAEDPTGTRGPEPGAEPQKEADDADLLSRLTGLRDSGVLSEEEFQLAVKDLLGDSRLQEGTLSEDSGDTTPVPTPPIAPVPKDPRASGSQSGETPPASDELLRRKAELDEAEAELVRQRAELAEAAEQERLRVEVEAAERLRVEAAEQERLRVEVEAAEQERLRV